MDFIRNCPECNKEITASNKNNLKTAIKKKRLCRSCGSKTSKKTLKYKRSREFNCIHCSKKIFFKNPQKIESTHQCRSCQGDGEKNSFYNKKHTEKTKEKISISQTGKTRTEEWKKNFSIANSGKNSPMFGKTAYDIWLEKYGKEEADQRKTVWKNKLSIAHKGKKNPMYGKPAVQGSSNGWSGWYKGWFFRSLLELSYVVKVLEQGNLKWCSAETKDFMIPYINSEGTDRTYFPDFFVDSHKLIEIKPVWRHTTIPVLLKKEAAEKFCIKKGWQYELLEPEMLTDEEILELYSLEEFKFLPKYEEKFVENIKIGKHKNFIIDFDKG
jgi:hypothetical protein